MEEYLTEESENFIKISHFEEVWKEKAPSKRLELGRKQAVRFREYFLNHSSKVPYYRSFNLVRVPYPTTYAFNGHATSYSPFIHIVNRLFIVQFNTKQGLKTLLVSPTDVQASKETPYFKRLSTQFGMFQSLAEPIIAPRYSTVEQYVEMVGLKPEHIDYITFDHLHTQNIQKWFGNTQKNIPAYFPNAKLLVPRQEWESTNALLPNQADWYCPGGTQGVPADKVVLLDNDVIIGDGVALIRTPGHTEGNQSIVVHTDEGLLVTSENGVGADAYSPHQSNIPGIRAYAAATGVEVIMNGNTLEHGLNQYVSMVIEKSIAGPSVRNTNFYNVVSSSEMSWYWLFPVTPSFTFDALHFGKISISH